MDSLTNLCYNNIANTIENAPPLLQEMIIGETRDRIKENMKNEVLPLATKEVQINICKELPYLVADIMKDIVDSITISGRARRNFREEFSQLPKELVECAILTAEESVRIMEEHYIHRAFVLNNSLNEQVNDLEDY